MSFDFFNGRLLQNQQSNTVDDMVRPHTQRGVEIVLNPLLMRSKNEFKCCPSYLCAMPRCFLKRNCFAIYRQYQTLRCFEYNVNRVFLCMSVFCVLFPILTLLLLTFSLCSICSSVYLYQSSVHKIRNHSAINMPNNEKWRKIEKCCEVFSIHALSPNNIQS